ncbi:hypothetical protein J2S92_002707 [Arthrobacter bambusae]|nr:hypothetical protein [Arthrobacter bambusae]MDQ0236683.1 hypothetical protein [Arthrobacter bambusae]
MYPKTIWKSNSSFVQRVPALLRFRSDVDEFSSQLFSS